MTSTPHPKATTTQSPEPSWSDDDLSEIEDEPPKLTIKDHLHDIDAFFDEPAKVKDSNKPKRGCKICGYAISFIFLIYYSSTYLLDAGKKESSKQLFVKLPPSVDILRLSVTTPFLLLLSYSFRRSTLCSLF